MIKYVSIDDIANNERYPFTKGQVRHFIANRNINGLSTSIRKIGRRVYIREDLFDEWVESFKDEITVEDRVELIPISLPLGDIPIGDNGSVLRAIKVSIDEMGLSVRAKRCLYHMGIKYVCDLTDKTETELLECKSMGKKSLNEIKDKLLSYGLTLEEE